MGCTRFTTESARKATKIREENKHKLWNFVASGGARKYLEKLEQLAEGKALSKPEREFMDRVERMFPYVKARLAQTDSNINVSGSVTHTIEGLVSDSRQIVDVKEVEAKQLK